MIENLVSYKAFPIWNMEAIPEKFKQTNKTDEDTWIKFVILKGEMEFAILDNTGNIVGMHYFTVDNQPPFIIPKHPHKIITVSEDIQFQLSFYCSKEDYCRKKYGLTQTLSDVINISKFITKGKVLDLGCGSGRNSLYLNLLGFDVDAVDKNEAIINNLKQIIRQDYLTNITAQMYDINQANWLGQYDYILSTMVMMFLPSVRIPYVIANMQTNTKSNGYNLIISAMSTKDNPCHIPFPSTFKEDELRHYYRGWNIIEYNENIRTLHNADNNGKDIKLHFAKILAQKK